MLSELRDRRCPHVYRRPPGNLMGPGWGGQETSSRKSGTYKIRRQQQQEQQQNKQNVRDIYSSIDIIKNNGGICDNSGNNGSSSSTTNTTTGWTSTYRWLSLYIENSLKYKDLQTHVIQDERQGTLVRDHGVKFHQPLLGRLDVGRRYHQHGVRSPLCRLISNKKRNAQGR